MPGTKQQMTLLLTSIVWALAIIVAAVLFRHNPSVYYWIESAIMVGFITSFYWQSRGSSRTGC